MILAAMDLPERRWREVELAAEEAPGRSRTHGDFVRLAEAELDRAYRLAGLILGDATEAEDAVQDAMYRGWRAAESLRRIEDFRAWFDRILVNGCRDRLRRRGRVRFVALETGASPAVADPFRAVLDRDEALRSIAVLEPDERVVIVLHYWADLTLDDIGRRLGWPLGTVKSRLHRGLERIRHELEAAQQ